MCCEAVNNKNNATKYTQETQDDDYKMMSHACILIIYTSEHQYIIFEYCNSHKAKGEQTGMVVMCVDQKEEYTL